MKLTVWTFVVASVAWCQPQGAQADRVGSTGFVQLEADSFRSLKPQQEALAYWLSQASIAISPIIYDQLSRFGLRQKRALELIVANPGGVDQAAYQKILAFTKLFWANRGNHNENTAEISSRIHLRGVSGRGSRGVAAWRPGIHRAELAQRDRGAETFVVGS